MTKSITVILTAGCLLALTGACERDEPLVDRREDVEGAYTKTPRAVPTDELEHHPEEMVKPEGTVAAPARDTEPSADSEPTATADFEVAEGSELDGEAKLYAMAGGVKLVVDIEDTPPGMKGLHIHEKGDCSDIPGKSMGGHFAPKGHDHALPKEKAEGERHLGDLGNIEVGADGKGHLEATLVSANLKQGDPMSLLGKAVVIHSGQDTGKAKQPAGDSGTPMACGVIE